jgi:hypothetical protein
MFGSFWLCKASRLGRVRFLRSVGAFKHFNVEEVLVFGWNVLEKGEDAVVWVLVAESVHDEAVGGDKGVSIHRGPVFNYHKHARLNQEIFGLKNVLQKTIKSQLGWGQKVCYDRFFGLA